MTALLSVPWEGKEREGEAGVSVPFPTLLPPAQGPWIHLPFSGVCPWLNLPFLTLSSGYAGSLLRRVPRPV